VGSADARGLTVAFAADTHLHADFLTGAVQLAQNGDATVLASAAGRSGFARDRPGNG
jgi:glyoxylase-like metal-dependent hydrolase (beta-lactamase superfamily II)